MLLAEFFAQKTLPCTAKFFGKVFLVDLSANQFDSCRVCLVPPTEHDFDNGQLSSL